MWRALISWTKIYESSTSADLLRFFHRRNTFSEQHSTIYLKPHRRTEDSGSTQSGCHRDRNNGMNNHVPWTHHGRSWRSSYNAKNNICTRTTNSGVPNSGNWSGSHLHGILFGYFEMSLTIYVLERPVGQSMTFRGHTWDVETCGVNKI